MAQTFGFDLSAFVQFSQVIPGDPTGTPLLLMHGISDSAPCSRRLDQSATPCRPSAVPAGSGGPSQNAAAIEKYTCPCAMASLMSQ